MRFEEMPMAFAAWLGITRSQELFKAYPEMGYALKT
jgi:hypothetical protein